MIRSWSLEQVVVEVLGRAAVGAQGILDAVWPPRFPAPVGDSHPIPGCPSPVDCRTHGCAETCHEATEVGGNIVIGNTFDATGGIDVGTFGCTTCAGGGCTDCAEPQRPPGFYTMMNKSFAHVQYGFPPLPMDKERHVASDGGIWVFNNLGGGEWDATNYPPDGDPYFAVKARERAAKSSTSDALSSVVDVPLTHAGVNDSGEECAAIPPVGSSPLTSHEIWLAAQYVEKWADNCARYGQERLWELSARLRGAALETRAEESEAAR